MELNLLSLKIKLNLQDRYPLIFMGLVSASASVVLASWGNFQQVEVYKVHTGLKNEPSYKVLVREFDRHRPDFTKGGKINPRKVEKVAHIYHTATHLKLLASAAGALLSLGSLLYVLREEKEEPAKQYLEYGKQQIQKAKTDAILAVEHQMANEEALVHAGDLMTELMMNDKYRELKDRQRAAEFEEDYDAPPQQEEEEEDEWNPILDDDDSTPQDTTIAQNPEPQDSYSASTSQREVGSQNQQILTTEQIHNILIDYRQNQTPLPKAIFMHTGISKNNPEFMQVVREIKKSLNT